MNITTEESSSRPEESVREESSSRPEESVREENSNSYFFVKESILNKWRWRRDLRNEAEAEKEWHRNTMRNEMKDPAFKEEMFGETITINKKKTADSLVISSVVSIALYNGDVLVYACSGTAVDHSHGNIRDFHTIFVTSARLAQKFNDNRTRDDNLRIVVRTSDKRKLHGFLGLYDVNIGIAIVTSFSLECVYTMSTSNPMDRTRKKSFKGAFGCATDGTLMRASCSHSVLKDKCEVYCKITEIGHGGPVMYFARDGSLRIAGLIVKSCEDRITLLPTKKLHDWLQHVLLITSNTTHFRGYSLPEGVETVIPSGFMVESMILESLGYPLPPPLLFELNGRLAGGFEEHFGQLHYWKGYPFDFPLKYGENAIWDQLGETLAREISQRVVSIASFKGRKRCFACTGLLIRIRDCVFVLTSANLVRAGDVEGEIDEKLTIEVFVPRNHSLEGILQLYHLDYNIALVRIKQDLIPGMCPQDILNVREPSKPDIGCPVVAIGRATKRSYGLMMASKGEVKGKYNAVTECKNKRSTGLTKKLNCKDLCLSTCQIKKVGIGGPLIGLDGSFIGMNFYDESKTTPFLPMEVILEVLIVLDRVNLSSSTFASHPVNMEKYMLPCRKRKRNQWPVPKPYWFLAGQVHPLDQLVGKVLM